MSPCRKISRANLVGAVAGFLLYAVLSTLLHHLSSLSSLHKQVLMDKPAHVTLTDSLLGSSNHSSVASTGISHQFSIKGKEGVIDNTEDQSYIASSAIGGCGRSREKDFCNSFAKANGIVPLSTDILHDKQFVKFKEQWILHNCENFFKHEQICTQPVPKCTKSIASRKKQPLIAVLAATTTRRVNNPAIDKIALFTLLLPSLVRNIDCGFRYVYVMGYDKGDPYYDIKHGIEDAKSWFYKEIEFPMKQHGISITMSTVEVDNAIKKPGPVFLEMARQAYALGADFFYRVNDDTEFRGRWPKAFTEALMKLPPPYGVIGPKSLTSNLDILTHDFVHRTHMDIMKLDYYPKELPDWWMDNWISKVYGEARTFYSEDAAVMHHTYAHGQRYKVNRNNQKYLPITLARGRKLIALWMRENNVSPEDIKAFEIDESFRKTFKFKEIKSINSSRSVF